MFSKLLLANIIELAIPCLPVIYSYFYKKLMIFEYLSFFEMLAVVYLTFNCIALISTKGNSIGFKLVKLALVNMKDGKVNLIKNGLRILIIAGFIFLIGEIGNIDYTFLLVFVIMIIPVPITYQNKTLYSLINRLLGLEQTNLIA